MPCDYDYATAELRQCVNSLPGDKILIRHYDAYIFILPLVIKKLRLDYNNIMFLLWLGGVGTAEKKQLL